jgi:hypothetical protein
VDGALAPAEPSRPARSAAFPHAASDGSRGEDQMDFGRTGKVAALSVAIMAIGIGGSGCKLLKAVAKTQKHAAIAFDVKTGGWGYSYDQLTEDLANAAATAKCGTCTVQLSWNQGCGALAQSATKKDLMTTGTGPNRAAAEGAAKSDCVSKGGGTCNVLVYSCNSTN